MDRQPIVAGQFYPGSAQTLEAQVRQYLAQAQIAPQSARAQASTPPLIIMVPHAGYVFSGPVTGLTLGAAPPHPTVLLLGPNHTGLGAQLSLWPSGRWLLPGGALNVDEELTAALVAAEPRITPDHSAHIQEHSLEVLLPFLHALNPNTTIAPLAVAEPRGEVLFEVGKRIAKVLKAFPRPVTMVVSSDMNHFADDETTRELDAMALERIQNLDPRGLMEVVRAERISMCGVLPMTVALVAALELGAAEARLTAYDTSARAAGDSARVVGYAGVIVR